MHLHVSTEAKALKTLYVAFLCYSCDVLPQLFM